MSWETAASSGSGSGSTLELVVGLRLRLGRGLRLGVDQALGDRDEVLLEVTTDHVAQQRPQVAGELVDEQPGLGHGRVEAGDDRALERDRVRDPLGHLGAVVGQSADHGQAAGEPARGRTLGLEQRAGGEQVVAERLQAPAALAPELEAAQRPGHGAAARQAARDQVHERAQLVLDVGLEHQRLVRRRRRRERQRVHAPAACVASDPDAAGDAEGAVVEQPQRREQHAHALVRGRVRGHVAVLALDGQHGHGVVAL